MKTGKKYWLSLLFLLVLAVSILSLTALAAEPEEGETIEEVVSPNLLQAGGLLPNPGADRRFLASQSDPYAAAKEAILQGLQNWQEEISLSAYGIPASSFHEVYIGLLNDHPELFYVNNGYSYGYNSSGVTRVMPNYEDGFTKADVARFQSVCQEIQAMIDPGWSELEKFIFIHDYIVTHCEYDLSYSYYDAYHVLVTGSAVCQGYALAFNMLSKQAGVSSSIVTSDAINHAWNLVSIGGKYYYVDCTWDDPSNQWYEGYCGHDNFLQSRSAFHESHDCTDWTDGIKNIYSGTPGATTYDNAWFRDLRTATPLIGHTCAYTDGEKIYLRNMSKNTVKTLNLPNSNQWYYYSSFAQRGGTFYFSNDLEIWSMTTAGKMTKEYTLSSAEQKQGDLYGLVNCSGNIVFNIGTSACNVSFVRKTLKLPDIIDVPKDYVGLTEYNGRWVYVKNQQIDTSFVGLAQNENGWWYVRAGELDLTFTGLVTNENGTWYIYKGQLADWRDGCEWVNGEYCEFYKGQLTTWKKDATVVDPYGDGNWVSMRYGKIDRSYTGIAENANGFWYIKNGTLDLTFTGLVTNDYGTWFIYLGQLANWRTGCDWVNGEYCEFVEGQLTTWKKDATLVDPYGDDNWVSMRYGRIDMGYTGLADNEYGWWYVKDGRLNRELTDLVTNDYGTWYVYKGQLVTWKDGIQYVEKRGNSYYIYKGQLADWYTGDVTENGVVYHVSAGLVTGAN